MTPERLEEIREILSGNANPTRVRVENAAHDLLAEIDALRAEAPPTTYLHPGGTEEPIGELVERLTRERDAVRAELADLRAMYRCAECKHNRERSDKAEARVREREAGAERDAAEAKLAALVEVVNAFLASCSDGHADVLEPSAAPAYDRAEKALRATLPGIPPDAGRLAPAHYPAVLPRMRRKP